MYYKFILINALLNGKKYNYDSLSEEKKKQVLHSFNIFILNNKGIFCLEKKALRRYFNIVKSFGYLGYDTLYSYTIINDIKIYLSKKDTYNYCLEKYISDTLNKYKDESEIIVENKNRIKQVKHHLKKLFSTIIYIYADIDYLSIFYSKDISKQWLENSLKFLIKNDEKNILKYYDFIQFYYEKTGCNLLNLAKTNIISFKKVKNGI